MNALSCREGFGVVPGPNSTRGSLKSQFSSINESRDTGLTGERTKPELIERPEPVSDRDPVIVPRTRVSRL